MQNMDLVQNQPLFSVQGKRSEILSAKYLQVQKFHLVRILAKNDFQCKFQTQLCLVQLPFIQLVQNLTDEIIRTKSMIHVSAYSLLLPKILVQNLKKKVFPAFSAKSTVWRKIVQCKIQGSNCSVQSPSRCLYFSSNSLAHTKCIQCKEQGSYFLVQFPQKCQCKVFSAKYLVKTP